MTEASTLGLLVNGETKNRDKEIQERKVEEGSSI